MWGARHDQPFHVVGSDAAGRGAARRAPRCASWKPGDAVTVHCNHVDDQDPSAHDDSMLATNQRIWGYETNYGGLGEVTLVKANQLMPKPAHLTWEEAAVNALDQLHELPHAREPERRADDAGPDRADLGRERRDRRVRVPVRAQRRRDAGRRGVESRSAPTWCATMGVEHVIDRTAEGYQFWKDDAHAGPGGVAPARQEIRELVGRDPDIVFEHPGRSTMGASVFVCTRGGTIVTCAATTGFMIEYDNRYLWMNQKTLKGCHFANYREAWEANRLIGEGRIHPVLSAVFPFDQVGGGRAAGAPQPARGQARRAGARARGGPRRHRPRAARASTSTRSRCSAVAARGLVR